MKRLAETVPPCTNICAHKKAGPRRTGPGASGKRAALAYPSDWAGSATRRAGRLLAAGRLGIAALILVGLPQTLGLALQRGHLPAGVVRT